ncbi:hypothetical protein AB835_05050 [Candidatus Endobugula sertula]|uniref:DUF350 domain-containing protein n=1 Tax=Candidatus Endobugula sertula TaxID=62101 RepID=A0A1D2QRA0_9GAMM|nr:hypothetical protein AB835_05050 [Candidatus Endobugula sertula]
MDIDIISLFFSFYSAGSLLLAYLLIFLVANFIYDKKVSYDVKQEIVEKDNGAVAISLAGYLVAISIIFIAGVIGPSKGVLQDLFIIIQYSLLGIILLYVAHIVNDKLILNQFNNVKELVNDQNTGTGVVQAASYIASGLIIAGAIHGEGGGILTTITFFALGQLVLVIFSKIYDLITSFNLHDEIEDDNFSVGIAFSGTLIALGIILSKASAGNFISWQHNISVFVLNAVIAFILLPVFRVIIDKLIIVGNDLNIEIARDKNTGAGVLEFSATIGFAAVLFFVI